MSRFASSCVGLAMLSGAGCSPSNFTFDHPDPTSSSTATSTSAHTSTSTHTSTSATGGGGEGGASSVSVASSGGNGGGASGGGGGGGGVDFDFTLSRTHVLVREQESVAVDVAMSPVAHEALVVTVACPGSVGTDVTVQPLDIAPGTTNGTLHFGGNAGGVPAGPVTCDVTATAMTGTTRQHTIRVAFGGPSGTLDDQFGTSGCYTGNVNGATVGRGLYATDDATIVTGADVHAALLLVRLDERGVLDPGFATGGVATRPIGGGAIGDAVVGGLGAGGNIVVVGAGAPQSDQQYAMVGFTSKGLLNTAFGTLGFAYPTQVGSGGELRTLDVIGSDLIVGGSTGDLFRVGVDGTTGLTTPFDKANVQLFASAVDKTSAPTFVAAGAISANFWMKRFTSSDVPDTTFAPMGTVRINDTRLDVVHGVVVLEDRSLVLFGISTATGGGGTPLLKVARVSEHGVEDAAFGGLTGITFSSRGTNTLVRDSLGRFIFAGYTTGALLAVIRFTSSGVPDTSFGPQGTVTFDCGLAPGSSTSAYGVAVDSLDRIVVSGTAGPDGNTSLVAARIWP